MSYGQNVPQEVGGNEIGVLPAEADADWEAATGEVGGASGNVDVRLCGDAASLPFGYGVLIGGILTQLMADAEARLGEMRECVDWYQREVQKCEQRLSDLQQLAALAQGEQPDEE